ncbi:unnamed protein product, partial [Oikopleura dioica]
VCQEVHADISSWNVKFGISFKPELGSRRSKNAFWSRPRL